MKITFAYRGYNGRRYSKPWGAVVTAKGTRLEYEFDKANYLGDDAGGEVYIECQVGDVIATGQKDNRGSSSKLDLYIVQEDGDLVETDRAAALKHLLSRAEKPSPLAEFSTEELLAELQRRGVEMKKDL